MAKRTYIVDVFIVAAKRTAMGDFGKAFKDKTATDLAEFASRAVVTVSGQGQCVRTWMDRILVARQKLTVSSLAM
jgi:acetyl-CoA acetyltransferase